LPPSEPAPAAAKRPPPEKITLDTDTYFDFDKASLKPEGQRKLDEIASRLTQMALEVVVATGHTDSIGTDKYNENLSRRRAEAVKTFLESRGLPADRIHTDAQGEKQPVASNTTRDGRAKNRRVEVEVVGEKTRN
jgi:OOP family OmpA-OmpF porin